MKIIQIGPYPLDANHIRGGVEASIFGLSSELSKSHKVLVMDIPRVTIINDYIENENNPTIYRFSSSSVRNYKAILRIKSIVLSIRKQKPDICHIHSTNLFSLIMFLYLHFYKLPVIVTVHGLEHIEKQKQWKQQRTLKNFVKYFFYSFVEFSLLSICPIIIVDTQYVINEIKIYKKQWKIIRIPKYKIIPQGINPSFFRLTNADEKKHILSIGTFTRRKGHLHLIDAMINVKKVLPNFCLIIAGALSDKCYYEKMYQKIKDNNLDKNILIYPNVSFDKILELYKRSYLFILHSEEESQGIVLCEAMAAGKAIVATNVGGIPFIIKHGINGLLSDFGQINDFANHIINLMSNNNMREKIEIINRKKAVIYNWNYIANEIEKLYDYMIKKYKTIHFENE
jgi:glycosyltransferase involved in cell wall biosynthesis